MNVEQLMLGLPSAEHQVPSSLTVHQWSAVVDQFASLGGRELLLGGAEPLAFPGFWVLVRRSKKARIPKLTAQVSGPMLEPWVRREAVESGIHLLIPMDSLQAKVHDRLHGHGRHAKTMAAIDSLLEHGMAPRTGLLVTASPLNGGEIPALVEWAAERGFARVLWTTAPDSGWPSPQFKARFLSREDKQLVARQMTDLARTWSGRICVAPLDPMEAPHDGARYCRTLRVGPTGDVNWGFSIDGERVGSVRRASLEQMVEVGAQAVGD